jgi:putative phage-type endonuclease
MTTMKIIDCEQQSEEWFQTRLGKVTASHFKDVMNKKSGRETYMMRLLAERVTGIREESYSNRYMEDGIELEPEAREHYEWIADTEVGQVGFVEKTEHVGCSPDGLIGADGMLEIKCPKVTTHLGYIVRGVLPATYKAQVQGQLWVCERQWCDFISYAPEYEKQPMFCVRAERDETFLSLLSVAVATFVTELEEMEKKL